jgi:23S rRNA pseudouridine2605 synthase
MSDRAMARKLDISERPRGAERIAKVMARAGLCSRREAEAWIAAGRVAVNGKPVASPALDVAPADRITVDGAPLPQRERTRLFLYHKPGGLLVSHTDARGRPTVFAALPGGLPRLISVGRLDLNTEGLLLLTNDGGLARTLELPATGWLRRYRVRAHGRVTQAALDRLRDGTVIEGVRYGPIEARLDREQGANLWLTFAMREGKNREIKNVLGHLGLAVNRLIRVSYGPFQLGDLPEGAIEEVRTRMLRDQLGERIAARAGADFSLPRADAATPQRQHSRAEADQQSARRPQRLDQPVARAAPAPAPPKPRGPNRPGPKRPGPKWPGPKRRRSDAERIGEPELARRQRRRSRRAFRGVPPPKGRAR